MSLVIREKKSKKGRPNPAPTNGQTVVDLTPTTAILHQQITASLCRTVFQRLRTTERQRAWTLQMLVDFWTAVILRAPASLTQALQECAQGQHGWPQLVATTPEAFFQRSRDLKGTFFAGVLEDFLAAVVPGAPTNYAPELAALRAAFPEIWIFDGSRLDAVAHRLKILHHVTATVLPGCIEVAYDLWRGIPRRFQFSPDAAASELTRALGLLPELPCGTLMLGDRLYASVKLFAALQAVQCHGLFRRNASLSMRKLQCLRRGWIAGGKLEEWCVEVGSGQTAPKQTLRYLRYTRDRVVYELLTDVFDAQQLPAVLAFNLYGFRWSVERMFFDLKEVLNLHRFYAGNPNAVAMQVYAAALVYTAMRIAQGQIAQAQGIAPERISPAKLFPRVAATSLTLAVAEQTYQAICQANPGRRIRRPDLRQAGVGQVPLAHLLVEKRKGPRRRRRFCRGRTRWKSFAHIKGGKKFTAG